jgi:primase-polymerase (primpol)-like protein
MPEIAPSKQAIIRAYGDSLVEYDQWICWKEERRDGDWTKLPMDPESEDFAQTDDETTWSSFENAWAIYSAKDAYDGIGFVFTADDPFVGVDLDHCVDPQTADVEQWAKEIIGVSGAPAEASPSGTGLHLYCRGVLSGKRNRNDEIGIEIYDDVRYFTVTGRMFRREPPDIPDDPYSLGWLEHHYMPAEESVDGDADMTGELDHPDEGDDEESRDRPDPKIRLRPTEEEMESMPEDADQPYPDHSLDETVPPLAEGWYDHLNTILNSKKGDRFERLWNGDICDNPSQSEADMEFCCRLAFWFHDAQSINTVITKSGLYRGKWNRVHRADGATYGEMTVEKALNLVENEYGGDGPSEGPLVRTSESGPTSARDPADAALDQA